LKVNLTDLRVIADRLLMYLEETGRTDIEVSEDYYWHIAMEDAYDVSRDPTNITIGQLSDDWRELERIMNNEAPPIGYALVWLSAIMRIIGEKTIS
jgi:hypothetical protein